MKWLWVVADYSEAALPGSGKLFDEFFKPSEIDRVRDSYPNIMGWSLLGLISFLSSDSQIVRLLQRGYYYLEEGAYKDADATHSLVEDLDTFSRSICLTGLDAFVKPEFFAFMAMLVATEAGRSTCVDRYNQAGRTHDELKKQSEFHQALGSNLPLITLLSDELKEAAAARDRAHSLVRYFDTTAHEDGAFILYMCALAIRKAGGANSMREAHEYVIKRAAARLRTVNTATDRIVRDMDYPKTNFDPPHYVIPPQ